ncbi:hypothetical protein Csa_016832, partial [Cucumis sativus]
HAGQVHAASHPLVSAYHLTPSSLFNRLSFSVSGGHLRSSPLLRSLRLSLALGSPSPLRCCVAAGYDTLLCTTHPRGQTNRIIFSR